MQHVADRDEHEGATEALSHRVRPRDIAALAQIQSAMIAHVARWLAPGGTLIYATCSLEPAEGEAQVAVAEAAGLIIDPISPSDFFGGPAVHWQGWLRVLPRDHFDGFFIARFKRE